MKSHYLSVCVLFSLSCSVICLSSRSSCTCTLVHVNPPHVKLLALRRATETTDCWRSGRQTKTVQMIFNLFPFSMNEVQMLQRSERQNYVFCQQSVVAGDISLTIVYLQGDTQNNLSLAKTSTFGEPTLTGRFVSKDQCAATVTHFTKMFTSNSVNEAFILAKADLLIVERRKNIVFTHCGLLLKCHIIKGVFMNPSPGEAFFLFIISFFQCRVVNCDNY